MVEAEKIIIRPIISEKSYAQIDPRKADPDLADEMVRKDLGLVRTDEVVVPLGD
jgi:hypothetical protein